MADTKITGLVEYAIATAPGTELLTMVESPGGTPINRKMTFDNFKSSYIQKQALVWEAPHDFSSTVLELPQNQSLGALGNISLNTGATVVADGILQFRGNNATTNIVAVPDALTPANGETVIYNSATPGWEYGTASAVAALDDLTDVTITSVTNDEILQFTGTVWENQTFAEAGIATIAGPNVFTGANSYNATGGSLEIPNTTDANFNTFNQLDNVGQIGWITNTDVNPGQPTFAMADGILAARGNTAGDTNKILIPGVRQTDWTPADGDVLSYDSTNDKVVWSAVSGGSGVQPSDNVTWTGTHNFSGSPSLILPVSNAPAVDTEGEIAVDSLVTGQADGVLTFQIGTAVYGAVHLPIADFTNPPNANVVSWNSTDQTFELVPSTGGSLGLDDLNDVTITTPSNGQVLEYNGAQWVNVTPSLIAHALTDHTNVNVPAPNTNDVLTFTGTNWEAVAPVASTATIRDSAGATNLQAADANNIVRITAAGAYTIIAGVITTIGTIINVVYDITGGTQAEVSVTAGAGVTLNDVVGGSTNITSNFDSVSLLLVSADNWVVSGAHDGVA